MKRITSYEPSIDRITVMVRDCSYTETSSNPQAPLILLEDNHREGYAGFAITCARPFCLRHHLVRDGVVLLRDAIDAITEAFPDMKDACGIAQGILRKNRIVKVAMAS
jgi:hypothetical protein